MCSAPAIRTTHRTSTGRSGCSQVLGNAQGPPIGTTTPPRKQKWYDTINYIGNPDSFCRQNLEKYGPCFKTDVFGGTTVFVGSAKAIQMAFNGDLKYTEIALPPTTMDMFGPYSLFQRPDLHRQWRRSALTCSSPCCWESA